MIASARSLVRADVKAALAAAGIPKERTDWSAWNLDAPPIETPDPTGDPADSLWVRSQLSARNGTAEPVGLWGSPTMREFDLLFSFFVRRGAGESEVSTTIEAVMSYFRRRTATSADGFADVQYRDPEEPEYAADFGEAWAQYNVWMTVWVWDRSTAS